MAVAGILYGAECVVTGLLRAVQQHFVGHMLLESSFLYIFPCILCLKALPRLNDSSHLRHPAIGRRPEAM